MATISSFPNNVDEYVNAEQVQKWHHGRTSGVYGAANNAAVTAATGMNIGVSAGVGWLTNAAGDGIVWWIDSALTLTVGTAHASLTRYDRVVVSWQLANNSYKPTVTIVAGTPSATPTPPTLTNNSSYRQISLAKIRVPAGTTSITSGMITDERLDESVCGLVTETAAIDTSVANAQISAMIAELEAALDSVISGGLVAHASTHRTGGSDALTAAGIGAAPASHTHGNMSAAGAFGSVGGKLVETGANGVATAGRKLLVGNTAPASVTGLSEGDIYIYVPTLA